MAQLTKQTAFVDKDYIEVNLDLHDKSSTSEVEQCYTLMQNNHNSRVLRCILTRGCGLVPVDLSNSALTLYIKKADLALVMLSGQVIDAKNGIVDFLLTRQALAIADKITCEVIKTGIDKSTMSFPNFTLEIDKTIVDEDLVESTNDFSALNDTLAKVTEWDNKFTGMYNDLDKKLLQKTNESYVNAVAFGVKEGFDVDVAENTKIFQELINYCADDKVIIFPSGNFVFNSVNLGETRNIAIKGASSPFASFAQKNIYTGDFIDKFTKIYCNAPAGETFFNHKSCVLILEDIAFYNTKKDNKGNFTKEEAKTNILMQHSRSEDATKNVEKGKAFCFNSAFYGWKVTFGSDFTFQHLEDEWGTGKVEEQYEYFKQSCVVASRCRFTRNGIAINQAVDGRLIDCSFNKNDYAIVLRENSGFTTIADCRIEWNNYNGIYSEKAHDITVSNCEFDCNGWAGLYAVNNTESNFNGVFRRNGAKIETTSDGSHQRDFVKNVHIYADGNLNCNFIGSNTVVKPISDVSSAPERPSNCSNFTNNKNCVVALNNLAGCTKKDKVSANHFDGNVDCIIDNNILVGRENYPV